MASGSKEAPFINLFLSTPGHRVYWMLEINFLTAGILTSPTSDDFLNVSAQDRPHSLTPFIGFLEINEMPVV